MRRQDPEEEEMIEDLSDTFDDVELDSTEEAPQRLPHVTTQTAPPTPGETGTPEETEASALVYTEPDPPSIRVRRSGSNREQPPTPPGVQEWDFQKLLASFQINWRTTTPYFALGRISRRAVLINWTVDDLKSVEAVSRIYNDIARRCPGHPPRDRDDNILPGSLICPCESRYGADPEVWKGIPCPAENLQAFRHFTQLIRDLEILPENHVDVMQVVEIVKLLVYESRCDLDIQDEGRMYDLQVGQLNQQNNTAYYNKVTPVALITQAQLAQRRQKIYKDLVATRELRAETRRKEMKAAAALGTAGAQATVVGMMTRFNTRNIENRRSIQIESARVGRAVEDEIDEGEDDIPSPRQLEAPQRAVELTDNLD